MTNIKEISNKNIQSNYLYASKPIFKTIIKITFPVFILMLVNSLYQLIDNLLAANLVEYSGATNWSGAQTATMIIPIFALVMAFTILTSFGFGTIYAQSLGKKDEKSAIKAQSTAFWGTLIINTLLLVFIFTITPSLVDFFMGNSNDWSAETIKTIRKDAILSAYTYTIVIIISSFQSLLSRNLRTEGHIKSMSYIPLISIPINITLDLIFMGPVGMKVVGAALASLIAILITFIITIFYWSKANKKEETHFKFSNLKHKIDLKILTMIIVIGLTPFITQFLRAYSFTLNLYLIKKISPNSSIYGEWMVFFSSVTRPMTLVIMPSVAVMQSGAAFLGYNYGAKNYSRVWKGVGAMAMAMILFALPQYIIMLSITKYLLLGFGVPSDATDWNIMIKAHRAWTGVSIMVMSNALAIIYFMNTKKNKFSIPLIIWNQFIVLTIVYLSFYFSFIGTSQYYLLFFAWPITGIIIALSSTTLLIVTIIFDIKKYQKNTKT